MRNLQRPLRWLLLATVLTTTTALTTTIAETTRAANQEEDRAAIAQAIQKYVAAFNAQNANAMAELWSPEGVYVSRASGEQVIGREAIMSEFGKAFAEQAKRQLAVATEAIEFVSPNVAVERGQATVTEADQDPAVTAYRAVFVKRDGQWLLDRVTEDEPQGNSSNYEHLKGLEWIIGNWVDQSDEAVIDIECQWTANKNHISRAYTVSENGEVQSSGLQIVGWDPKEKRIRSWLFDSEGGFIEGTWTPKGELWIVQSVATLPDGSSGSFTSVFRPLNDSSFGWRKVHQVLGDEILPNLDEVIITRK